MRLRASYPHIVSTLALVVALGGTGAYAAGLAKDSVTSTQIKNGAIKAVDLGKNSVTSKAVAKNALTGKDIDEKSLAKVPSAATVDSVQHLTASPTQGQSVPLLTRGSLTLTAVCGGPTADTGVASLQMSTTVDHARWVTNNNVDPDFTVADGAAAFGSASESIAQIELSAVTPDGVSVHAFGHASAAGAQCRVDIVLLG